MSKSLQGNGNKSAMHRVIAAKLRGLFPQFRVLEEQSLETRIDGRKQTLYVDLFIKELNVAIECHGRQHFEFVAHFHGTEQRFREQQQRDQEKVRWLKAANYGVVVVRFDEYESLTDAQRS